MFPNYYIQVFDLSPFNTALYTNKSQSSAEKLLLLQLYTCLL